MKRSVLFTFTFIWLESFCSSQNLLKRRCNVAYSCSNEEKPVWATTTGRDCIVYRNGCHFLEANCHRINRDENEAMPILKDQCQALCGRICPPLHNPVCAFHDKHKMKTFGNQCEMEYHICRTGLTFSIFRAEPCPEELEYNQTQ